MTRLFFLYLFENLFLKEYRYDNKTVDQVTKLVETHDIRTVPRPVDMRRLIGKVGASLFPDYLKLLLADDAGKSPASTEEFMPRYTGLVRTYEEILAQKDPISLKDLVVKGEDLIAAGMQPGPQMGEVLHSMLDDVLETPAHNTRDWLLSRHLPEGIRKEPQE